MALRGNDLPVRPDPKHVRTAEKGRDEARARPARQTGEFRNSGTKKRKESLSDEPAEDEAGGAAAIPTTRIRFRLEVRRGSGNR